MIPIFRLAAKVGAVAVTVACVLAAWAGLGHAELNCVPIDADKGVVCDGSVSDGEEVNIGDIGSDKTFVWLRDVEVRLGSSLTDAVFNIGDQTVLIKPSEDGEARIEFYPQVMAGALAGIATADRGQGRIESHAYIYGHASLDTDHITGIRLRSAPTGEPDSGKTVDHYGEIHLISHGVARGIEAYGDGHSVASYGQINVRSIWGSTFASAGGVYAEANSESEHEGQTVLILNTGSISASSGWGSAAGITVYGFSGDDFVIVNGDESGNGSITSSGVDAWGIHAKAFEGVAGQKVTINHAGQIAVTGENRAVGIETIGYGAAIESSGSISVSTSGTGAGIAVEGEGSQVNNSGNIFVSATGANPVAFGMAAQGSQNVLRSEGGLEVTASGQFAFAAGMVVTGDASPLDVTAFDGVVLRGDLPSVSSMPSASGTAVNTIDNSGEMTVTAESDSEVAVALGLGSLDVGDGSIAVVNRGKVQVNAAAGLLSGSAAGAGMAGLGTGVALENQDSGSLQVTVFGADIGLGAGMLAAGQDYTVRNAGDIEVASSSFELAVAAGLISVDVDFASGDGAGAFLDAADREPAVLNDGDLLVSANANVAAVLGMGVVGEGKAAANAEDADVTVIAHGRQAALGLGMASVGTGDGGNSLYNHGTATVTAGGYMVGVDPAFAAGVGMAGLGGGNFLHNADNAELDVSAGGHIALAGGMVLAGGEGAFEFDGDMPGVNLLSASTDPASGAATNAGLGDGNALYNSGGGELDVNVRGPVAVAAGMVTGDESLLEDLLKGNGLGGSLAELPLVANSATNAGRVSVTADSTVESGEAGHAFAVGMLGIGAETALINEAEGELDVTAAGGTAQAAGAALAGTGSVINEGVIHARASGESSEAAAVRAVAVAGEIEVYNYGHVTATAEDRAAGVHLTAVNLLGGGPGHAVLTNTGTIAAEGAATSAGVVIGTDAGGVPLGTVHVFNKGVITGVSADGTKVAIAVEDRSVPYEEIRIVNEGDLEGDVILGAGKVEVEIRDGSNTQGSV